ncbi:MAG: UvrD-helicase domain-containing protein [Firmicutes bacterium]|nr:UvrD-helicase domain-containing protein [Bacillota bacterium]
MSSAHRWTPEQQAAIDAAGGHVLVAAAAGSGKTAVLVERIIRRIMAGGVDVDRLLMVTFTEAAAAEMRHRIVQALENGLRAEPQNGRLLRQLLLVPKASISTLHAFCLSLLRRYFYRVELDPDFRVLDEQEAQLLRLEVLDEVLEQAYERASSDSPFARLVVAYGGPDGDGRLRQLVLDMYDYARSLPEPRVWLETCRQAYRDLAPERFGETPWARELAHRALVRLGEARRLLESALALALGPGGAAGHAQTLEEDIERVKRLESAAEQGWPSLAGAKEWAFPPLARAAKGEGDVETRKAVQQLRSQAKRLVADAGGWFRNPPERHLADVAGQFPIIDALVEQVLRFDAAYAAVKAERGVVDFPDLEHFCLKLLEDPETAQEIRAAFDEVLVDECQDLNGVQDAILERLCPRTEGGRLFLVGDVKQSIYRFRQADPGLFLARYERASPAPGAGERRIDLSANFRSRRSVVDAVNFVFRQIMTPGIGETAYSAAAELKFAASYGPETGEEPVEVHILERDPRLLAAARHRAAAEAAAAIDTEVPASWAPAPEAISDAATVSEGAPTTARASGEDEEDGADLTAFEREAVVAARRIRDLVEGGQAVVWDRDEGRYRPARYGDVAVLLRATRHKANCLVDVFARLGVPAYAELGTGYFAATEVEVMLAVLSVLDNPRQDIPLAAVLRSPIGGLSAAELARIRAACKEGEFYDAVRAFAENAGDEDELGRRLRRFLSRLEEWRTAARRGPLSELVWRLLDETGFLDYAGAMPGGRQRQANLRALYERARQFDRFARQGLARFLRFVERLQEASGDLGPAPVLGQHEDVVRVMSVHGSKGLEFPIVFVLDLGRPFRRPPDQPHIAFHRELGIGAALVDGERRVARPSLLHAAVLHRLEREGLAEEMRILYVALTRARERLILIGSGRDVERLARRWSEEARKPGWTLDEARLFSAKSWLDWLGPALARHRDGSPLRQLGGVDLGSADPAVAGDPSRWAVRVWDASNVLALAAGDVRDDESSVPWDAVARLRPLPGVDAGPAREALEPRLHWRYPWKALASRPAKVSVSELKRRFHSGGEGEAAPAVAPPLRPLGRPRFVQAERPLSPTERGSAVHLVLQHLDLSEPLTEAGIRTQVDRLKARQVLTPEQAAAIDCRMLAAFFASPLGRRLQAKAARVHREIPFTLSLPAGQVYPELDPAEAAGEFVVVQGVIDCLLQDDGKLVVIDYKTDDVRPGAVPAAARRYEGQMALYCRAVREIYGRDASEAYVVFLAAGQAVRMPARGVGPA